MTVVSPARFPRVAPGAGHYESYYLKACHPDGGLGVWIRYTVLKRPGSQAKGFVWFTLFDAVSGVVAAKAPAGPLSASTGEYIRFGDSCFAPGELHGRALDAAWELRFAGSEPPVWHLPMRWMYDARFPRTKILSPHPHVGVDGRLTAGERSIELAGWPGTVGHNWGAEHAHRAIWLHCASFAGRDDTWLDVAIGRIRLGRLTTPWIANGALNLDGRRYRLGGLQAIRATEIEESPERCRFRLAGHGLTLTGAVGAPRERFVSWLYAQPSGVAEWQTVNCSIADLDLEVKRSGHPAQALQCSGGAAYELQMEERCPAIPAQPFPDG